MTLVVFLIVLSILIFVHELGHFWAARRNGVKVEEFGFGFPPRVWGKKIGETIYSINLLPIGGFVRLYGEDESVQEEKQRSFYYQNKLTRASVIVAGVLMNFLLAVLAFSVISWAIGVPKQTDEVKVVAVAENSPAAEIGLREGDTVIAVDGQKISSTEGFIEIINNKKGEGIKLAVKRDGEAKIISVTPREDPPRGEGALGVAITSTELVKPPLWQRPFVSVWNGFKEAVGWMITVFVAIGTTIYQAIRGVPPKDLAGPVGIFQITGQAAQQGALAITSFVGILSVNLAVLNILPFPALDGGRLLFIIFEGISGRRVTPRFERATHAVGMIILLLLLLLITVQDIGRLFTGGFNLL